MHLELVRLHPVGHVLGMPNMISEDLKMLLRMPQQASEAHDDHVPVAMVYTAALAISPA